jgi:hypothetical protein
MFPADAVLANVDRVAGHCARRVRPWRCRPRQYGRCCGPCAAATSDYGDAVPGDANAVVVPPINDRAVAVPVRTRPACLH